MPPVNFRLYLIGDRKRTGGRPLPLVVEEAGRAGIAAVQFREKDLPLSVQLQIASEIQKATKRRRMKLFINDRIDLCLALDAEGIHLPSSGIPVHVARGILGAEKWIAVSCHSLEEVRRAEREGADFAVLGPVYDTPSKRAYGPPLGISYFQAAKRSSSIPLFAIGGVTRDRLGEVFDAGADGVAMISEIVSAENVADRCGALLEEIRHLRGDDI